MRLAKSTYRTLVRGVCSVLVGALVAVVLSAIPTSAAADVFVIERNAGVVRHYSATGGDLGVFVSGLDHPAALTVDSGGNIYVAETFASKIHKYSPSGGHLLTIPLSYAPAGLRVGDDGTIYVTDYFAGSVYRYSPAGGGLGLFAAPGLARADFIEFDAAGNLYITDFVSGVVRRISPTGVDLGNFLSGLPNPFPQGVLGLAFDTSGDLYAANDATHTIERYSPSGVAMGTFASGLNDPYGLAFDSQGNLYVADYGAGTVRKFSPSGADLGVFASGLAGPRDLVIVDPVTSMPLALERGTVVLDARPNRDRATLEGWFSPPPNGIDPSADGIAINLDGPAGTMLALTIGGGEGWHTGKGPQWTFRDASDGSAGGSAARESIRIAFDRGKGVFRFWITIDGFDVENAGQGEIVTSLRIGAIEFKGSQDWRLTAKGRLQVTP